MLLKTMHQYQTKISQLNNEEDALGQTHIHVQKECACGSIIVYINTVVHSRGGKIHHVKSTPQTFWRRTRNVLGTVELKQEMPCLR